MAKKKEIFSNIEEARTYLEEAPVLLEKAKKGKKMNARLSLQAFSISRDEYICCEYAYTIILNRVFGETAGFRPSDE